MTRTKSQQQTAPSLTDPAEAALSEGIDSTSARAASKKKATSKKAASAKDATARDPEDPGAKAAAEKATKKKAASKKKASAKKEAPKPARYGRAEALIDALKKGGTRDEIAHHSDRLYVEHGGGESSVKGARAQLDVTLSTLKAAGVVAEDEQKRLKLAK